MKQKYSNQLQQHSYVYINSDTTCHICQKSLLNKKALHCKSKAFIYDFYFYLGQKCLRFVYDLNRLFIKCSWKFMQRPSSYLFKF
jgi:hypothetical protein